MAILPGSQSQGTGLDCFTIQANNELKLNIQKTKIMASGPITSWEIDEETDRKSVV